MLGPAILAVLVKISLLHTCKVAPVAGLPLDDYSSSANHSASFNLMLNFKVYMAFYLTVIGNGGQVSERAYSLV